MSIQSLESEQLLRLEKSVPNNPWEQKSEREPARLGEGGQEQRIDPDAEPRRQPQIRRCAYRLSENPADDGGGELPTAENEMRPMETRA